MFLISSLFSTMTTGQEYISTTALNHRTAFSVPVMQITANLNMHTCPNGMDLLGWKKSPFSVKVLFHNVSTIFYFPLISIWTIVFENETEWLGKKKCLRLFGGDRLLAHGVMTGRSAVVFTGKGW